ncbi:MAG: hypothetical protein AAFW01_16530 [Pseudomonadota bacterium]
MTADEPAQPSTHAPDDPATETADDTSIVASLERRITRLEDGAKKTLPQKIFSGLTNFGIPLATVVGVLSFYDAVWVRWVNEAREADKEARALLTELEKLNAREFELGVEGKNDVISALREARRGHRQRLIDELYAYHLENPDFLYTWEKQTLGHELILEGRTDDALVLANDIADEMKTVVEIADGHFFRFRALAASGPARDMEAARDAFRDAIGALAPLPTHEQRPLMVKYGHLRLFHELESGQPCERFMPVAAALTEIVDTYGMPATMEWMSDELGMLLETAAHRCP